jgi:hypothetical protein
MANNLEKEFVLEVCLKSSYSFKCGSIIIASMGASSDMDL